MNIHAELAELNKNRDNYQCRSDILINDVPLNRKNLTVLIAATAVGKSTMTQRILELAKEQGIDAGEAGTETTRPHRLDDGPTYRTEVPHEEMIERIKNRDYPNWSIHPSGHIYATTPESLTAEHNFLPCLPQGYPMLKRAGFAALNAFYIVTPAVEWDKQIENRKGLKDFPGRLDEAKSSLEFARSNRSIRPFVSLPGREAMTRSAQFLLNFSVFGNKSGLSTEHMRDDFEKYSTEMYRWAIILSNEYSDNA
ncbi:MAG: hypothetical protein QG549_163 [Patescibacteria group bacterium]|nr:hypothetical protein [Patescibacteria group bacterium]